MVLSHLIGDLKVTKPNSVYSSGSSADSDVFGAAAFSDSFVFCCTLLLLSFSTCRFTTTLFLSPRRLLSWFDASSTVTACTWFISPLCRYKIYWMNFFSSNPKVIVRSFGHMKVTKPSEKASVWLLCVYTSFGAIIFEMTRKKRKFLFLTLCSVSSTKES